MHLTLQTDYALRLLIYLTARGSEPASVGQVAAAYGISAHHLAKIAQRLARRGWIETARGRGGGLALSPAAGELTVGEVVREIETNRRIVECLGEHSTCPIESACGLKHAMHRATEAFLAVLDEYRLRDLVRRPEDLRVLLQLAPAQRGVEN